MVPGRIPQVSSLLPGRSPPVTQAVLKKEEQQRGKEMPQGPHHSSPQPYSPWKPLPLRAGHSSLLSSPGMCQLPLSSQTPASLLLEVTPAPGVCLASPYLASALCAPHPAGSTPGFWRGSCFGGFHYFRAEIPSPTRPSRCTL